MVNILSAKGPKRKPHIQLGNGFCIQFFHFYLSYVGSAKPTKTLCVTVHAPMTSLKVSILNRELITEGILNLEPKVDYGRYFTLFLSPEHFRGQVECLSSNSFILHVLIFACVDLRKVLVDSFFTLETMDFPEFLLFLDTDKQLNQ